MNIMLSMKSIMDKDKRLESIENESRKNNIHGLQINTSNQEKLKNSMENLMEKELQKSRDR